MPVLHKVQRLFDLLWKRKIPVMTFLVGDPIPGANTGHLTATVWRTIPFAIVHRAAEIEAEDPLKMVMAGAGNGSAEQRLPRLFSVNHLVSYSHLSPAVEHN